MFFANRPSFDRSAVLALKHSKQRKKSSFESSLDSNGSNKSRKSIKGDNGLDTMERTSLIEGEDDACI
jgi:hypothetical protein